MQQQRPPEGYQALKSKQTAPRQSKRKGSLQDRQRKDGG